MTPCATPHFGSILILGSGKTGLAVATRALNLVGGAVTSVTLYESRPREELNEDTLKQITALEGRGLVARFNTVGDGSFCITDISQNGLSQGKSSEKEISVIQKEPSPCVAEEYVYDLCVASPGISMFSDLFKAAQAVSAEVISEPEFAYRLSPNNWIAITGTNGKTTTTALLTHLINVAGGDAAAVGNIGTPAIEGVCHRRQEGEDESKFLVAELSSYQLATISRFHPRAAILLNITPDHIDWHQTHEHYRDSKLRMFENMTAGDVAVLNIDDPELHVILSEAKDPRYNLRSGDEFGPSLMRVSLTDDVGDNGGTIVDGYLTVFLETHPHRLCHVDDLGIKGDHNITNALCASCVMVAFGFEDDLITEGLMTFEPIEHRLQFVATVDGVSYYNDSKATNPDAVLKALTAFGDTPLTLMLGGYDKGTSLTELVAAASACCERVVLFGAAAPRFAEAFAAQGDGSSCVTDISQDENEQDKNSGKEISVTQKNRPPVLTAPTMLEALEVARVATAPGSALVLSPACASFDEFDSYEHRGEVFMRAVREMGGDRG